MPMPDMESRDTAATRMALKRAGDWTRSAWTGLNGPTDIPAPGLDTLQVEIEMEADRG